MLLVAGSDALEAIRFETGREPIEPEPGWTKGGRLLERVARQLDQYFAGRRREFDLPLDPHGTPFQRTVWSELGRIPYGQTISYGQLAQRIDRPAASRAVGAANGRNPIPIVIPCHRVIGSDGSLTGFGGGLPIKKKLLALEGTRLPTGDLFARGGTAPPSRARGTCG